MANVGNAKGKAAIRRVREGIAKDQQGVDARVSALKQRTDADERNRQRAVTQNPKTK